MRYFPGDVRGDKGDRWYEDMKEEGNSYQFLSSDE